MENANCTRIHCRLDGVRPLMMDKYAGDNNTSLPVAEKMYLDENRHLVIPTANLFSLLCAENTKSVCKQFLGKEGKTIGMGVKSGLIIPLAQIPVLGEDDKPIIFSGFDDKKFSVHKIVARLNKGVPNPKERPVIALPWALEFDIEYYENTDCTLGNLRQVFDYGGKVGIGTFRPFFGMYQLTKWEEIKD